MAVIKAIGLLLIFISAAFLGVFFSIRVRKRVKKIEGLCDAVKSLAADIKIGSYSRETLILKRFKENTVYISGGKPTVDRTYLKGEEADILADFLSELGQRDRLFEYERAAAFSNRLEEIFKKASAESDKICRLYCSMGTLIGIMLCILFI